MFDYTVQPFHYILPASEPYTAVNRKRCKRQMAIAPAQDTGWRYCHLTLTSILRLQIKCLGCLNSAADHYFYDLLVCLLHTFLTEPPHILDSSIYTFGDNTVASIKLLTMQIHLIAQNTGIHCCGDLSRAGRFGTVTYNTGDNGQCVYHRMSHLLETAAAQIGNAGTSTSTGTDCTAIGGQAAYWRLLIDGGQVGKG